MASLLAESVPFIEPMMTADLHLLGYWLALVRLGCAGLDNTYQHAKPLDPRNNSAVERPIAIHMRGRDEEIGMAPIACILQPSISHFPQWQSFAADGDRIMQYRSLADRLPVFI
jgi:hypothetical protein